MLQLRELFLFDVTSKRSLSVPYPPDSQGTANFAASLSTSLAMVAIVLYRKTHSDLFKRLLFLERSYRLRIWDFLCARAVSRFARSLEHIFEDLSSCKYGSRGFDNAATPECCWQPRVQQHYVIPHFSTEQSYRGMFTAGGQMRFGRRIT